MATEEDGRQYTKENPHPDYEDLSPKLKEYIYVGPDELPELPAPPENEWDPFIHGGRIGEDDESSLREEGSANVTDDGDYRPAGEELVSGDADKLPDLPAPTENGRDPFIHGSRIGEEDDE